MPRIAATAVALMSTSALAGRTAAASTSERIVIGASPLVEFKRAAAQPARSPSLADADRNDYVLDGPTLPAGERLGIVVREPDGVRRFQIPSRPAGVDAFEFLDEQLEAAREAEADIVRFPADEVFEIAAAAPVDFSDFHDVAVDLNGSTIRATEVAVAVKIGNSSTFSLSNGTIEGSGLLASVATVEIRSDGRPQFVVLPEYRTAIDAADATALVTVGSARSTSDGWALDPDSYVEMFTNRGGETNTFRYRDGTFVPTSPVASSRFTAGDHVWLLHQNNAGHGLLLDGRGDGLEDITLRDLRFVNIPGMGIAGEVRRGLHLDGVRFERSADPLAIFATSSDGVHLNAVEGDVVIENSSFGPNADDKINIKGNYWRVAELDEAAETVVVEPAGRSASLRSWGRAGHEVVFVDGALDVLGTARLGADSIRNDGSEHVVQLDRLPAGLAVGDLVANVDTAGARIAILNNEFVETRAQGVLVQTQHVWVAGNRFDGIAGPAIDISMELAGWYEGVNTDDVLVEDNVYLRSAGAVEKPHAVVHVSQLDENGRADGLIGHVIVRDGALAGTGPSTPDESPRQHLPPSRIYPGVWAGAHRTNGSDRGE